MGLPRTGARLLVSGRYDCYHLRGKDMVAPLHSLYTAGTQQTAIPLFVKSLLDKETHVHKLKTNAT